MIELVWDSRDLKFWRGGRLEAALVSALSKSGSDAIRASRTETKRKVRQRKRMKAGRIAKGTPLIFPGNKKTIHKLVWRMKVSGEAVPLADYPLRQTNQGVMVEINVGQRSLIKGAFRTVLKSGHKGVFRRVGSSRLPIKELFTTRLSDVASDQGFMPEVAERAQRVFGSAFGRLLAMELAKAAA
jgi:hypothetical protein